MMTRPRHPKPDSNNDIVPKALKQLGMVQVDASRLRYTVRFYNYTITALKIADMPGQTDWLILDNTGRFKALEVKEPGKEDDLSPGEKTWANDIGLIVVTTVEQVLEQLQ
jgi:hypothetical protein